MAGFEIVAHRGIVGDEPENTVAAFKHAIEIGADAVEFDVRLTADRIPVVYHYFYLEEVTTGNGPIFNRTLDDLRGIRVRSGSGPDGNENGIPTLEEVLALCAGKIGMEVEIKGPELEAPELIGGLLQKHKADWPSMEVISFEPALLLEFHRVCPGIAIDVLMPPSERWMQLDVVAYQAVHRAKLARARAVHLHSTQLSPEVVASVRSQGVEIHVWDVNKREDFKAVVRYGIPRICTDQYRQAMIFRNSR
jgi:glycerophosphoryl diester phosphodiesterase